MAEANQDVARWLRAVELEPGSERQDAIAAAANQLAGELSGRDLLDLVLLAFGDTRSPIASRVVEAVHASDATAALRPEDKETSLVAAVATAFGMAMKVETGGPLALATMIAVSEGLVPAIAELPDLSRRALIAGSEQLRERGALPEGKLSLKSAIEAAGPLEVDQAATTNQVKAVLSATQEAGKQAISAVNQLTKSLSRKLGAADEELELLWWCFSEFSELASVPFSDLSANAAPLILAAELSRRTGQGIPVPSTRALLSRAAGERAKTTTTIAQAVPAASEEVDDELLPNALGHRLLPVLSAHIERRQLNNADTWTASVRARWEIDPDREVTVLDLAEECTREILLVRSVG